MQQMNDRYTGQTQVKTRSVWRSANGQTELFIPVGGQAPVKDQGEIEEEDDSSNLAAEALQKTIKPNEQSSVISG